MNLSKFEKKNWLKNRTAKCYWWHCKYPDYRNFILHFFRLLVICVQYCIFNDKKNLSEIDLKVVKLGPFFDILQSLAMTNEIFLTTKKQLKEGLLFGISEEEIKSSAILCFFSIFGAVSSAFMDFFWKYAKNIPR